MLTNPPIKDNLNPTLWHYWNQSVRHTDIMRILISKQKTVQPAINYVNISLTFFSWTLSNVGEKRHMAQKGDSEREETKSL